MNPIIPTHCDSSSCGPLTLLTGTPDLVMEESLTLHDPNETVYGESALMDINWNDTVLNNVNNLINNPTISEFNREILTHYREMLIRDQSITIAITAMFGMSPGELMSERGAFLASGLEEFLNSDEYTAAMHLIKYIRPLREDGMCYDWCKKTARSLYAEMFGGDT